MHATERLRAIDDVAEVESRIDHSTIRPARIDLWLWSTGDGLDVFERVLALCPGGWTHDEDESNSISSRWERVGETPFIHDGVIAAEVVYRRWLSQVRRSRRQPERSSRP